MDLKNRRVPVANGSFLGALNLTQIEFSGGTSSARRQEWAQDNAPSVLIPRSFPTRLEDLLETNETCNACEHKLYCSGGCRDAALLASGDYLGCDNYMCYFFKNRYEDKIAAIYDDKATGIRRPARITTGFRETTA